MCVNPKWFAKDVCLPCGQCFECRMHQVNDWATRLMAESYTTPPTTFVTLTYNEDKLPYKDDGTPTFDREHLKRVCREIARLHPFRYYGIGEHGTDGERPHYHLICFGVDMMTIDRVLQAHWKPLGFYRMDGSMEARLMYVALFHVLKSHKYPDEFSVMSRRPGIGAYFFADITKEGRKLKMYLKDNTLISSIFRAKTGQIQLGGEMRMLPRYMLNQLDDSIIEDVKDCRRKHAYQRISNFTGVTILNMDDYSKVMHSLSDDKLQEWKELLHGVNKKKTELFVKRHRKARHVDTVK